jgi:hypothetical protein
VLVSTIIAGGATLFLQAKFFLQLSTKQNGAVIRLCRYLVLLISQLVTLEVATTEYGCRDHRFEAVVEGSSLLV